MHDGKYARPDLKRPPIWTIEQIFAPFGHRQSRFGAEYWTTRNQRPDRSDMAHTGQTLKNPASGERITFRQTAAETGGELLAIDLELPADRRVPGGQHIHPNQEERFEVIEGTMRFKMGRKRVIAGPGEVVVVPAGQKHDFANVGDDDALVRVEVRPALKMEQLFETAVGLAEQHRTMLGGIPKPLDLAVFTQQFEDEVRAAFPPRWLQRIALAPLAWVARRRRNKLSAPQPATI